MTPLFHERIMSDDKAGLHRRHFIKGGVAALGSLGLLQSCQSAPSPTPAPPIKDAQTTSSPSAPDLTQRAPAFSAQDSVLSACQFCNALCGLEVLRQHGRAIEVRGFKDDPVQAGMICVKAELMLEIAHNPKRLRTPLRRVSGAKGDPSSTFEPISWDQALERIAKKMLELRDTDQAHTIANRTTGRMLRGAGSVIGRFFKLLGSPNNTDVGPVCNDAGGNALAMTFGLGNFTNGYGVDAITGKEDLGQAKLLLFLGTNQAETHPVTFAHMLRARERTGAKLVVIDPRLTATGRFADEWISPKPHTDMAIALGMLAHIITQRLYDEAFIKQWVVGFDELVAHIKRQGYSASWADKAADLPSGTVAKLALEYAQAKPAAIFCNAGISHQLGAFDTYRCLAMLAAITGNIGVPGGGCNFMHNTWPGDLGLPKLKAKTPSLKHPALPQGPDSFPGAILDAKPYTLRMVLMQGNPIIASANTTRVKDAYAKLEYFVYTGLFMEEAALWADIILPVTSGLETEGVYMRRDDRGIRWQEAAIARQGQTRTDIELWVDLAQAMGKLDKAKGHAYWAESIPSAWRDYKTLWELFVTHTPGAQGMTRARMMASKTPLRWPCPTTEHPGTSTLYLDHPRWYEALTALDPAHKGKRFATPTGKIELTTPALLQRLASSGHSPLPSYYTHPEVTGSNPGIRYHDELIKNPVNPGALTPKVTLGEPSNTALEAEYPLMGMIGRASVVHFAGVTQWTHRGKRLNGIRLIQLHPKTAARANIKDGQEIFVQSPRGKIKGTALLWEGIREDTIFVPNSFGGAQLVGDEVGTPRYEPANTLVDDRYFDSISGQQAYKCFACKVTAVSSV